MPRTLKSTGDELHPAEEIPVNKSSGKRKGLLSCFIVLVIGALMVTIAVIVGIVVVPRADDWLTEHRFIGTGEQLDDDATVHTGREVVTEENWVTNVVDKTQKGVVSIAISEVTLNTQQGAVEESSNIGTGFIFDDSGLVLTNQHVVSDTQAEYVVVTSDNKEHAVTKIARDDFNDIAILEIDADGLEALTLGNSSSVGVGQMVVAIGTPLGDLPGTVTTGIISGLGRSVTASSGGFWATSKTYEDVIQTDAAINPGNSGGPLLDVDGTVIGINFATTSGADNISFAIPIDRVKAKIAEYKENGRFIRPYLGVEYSLISESEAVYYRNVVAGALVTRVVPNSPAFDAGIERGDIITKIDETPVTSSFSTLIQGHEVGDRMTLEIWRDGETIEKTVVLEEAE